MTINQQLTQYIAQEICVIKMPLKVSFQCPQSVNRIQSNPKLKLADDTENANLLLTI